MTPPIAVRFVPDNRVFSGQSPVDLFLAASACDILLDEPCGAAGTCGKCRVRFIEGISEPTPADRELLTPAELEAGWRLGCQVVLRRSATIELQSASRSVPQKSFGGPSVIQVDRVPVFAGPGGLGLAIDIGSTTLAVALVSLDDGRVESTASRVNPQVAFGADVMSRIHVAGSQPGGADRLKQVVRAELASMVRDVLTEAHVGPTDVVGIVCVGNPTMLHLWAGMDVTPLGRAPFRSRWTTALSSTAGEVDLPVRADAVVYSFPSVGSHVGADAVAAAVAAGIDRAERPCLVLDLGTNSEVVAGCRDGLVAASTAAGPAFEGASLACGMRASRGAIDSVCVNPDGRLFVDTMEHAPAMGLCGSGLIDAVAELLRTGVIAESGYLKSAQDVGDSPLAERITSIEGRRAVVLADDTLLNGRRVVLTAPDIRQFQLAKGSIRAGISVVCQELNIREADLDAVLVAGLFGSHLRKASLLRIGLVPRIDPERVRFIGNAAGIGARMALLDERIRGRARQIAERTRLIDLASHPSYLDRFHESLSLLT